MLSALRRIASSGILVGIIGVLTTIAGGSRTFHFLLTIHRYEKLTVRQLVELLVLPHAVMLLGAGITIAGIVLMIKQAVIRDHMRATEL